MVYCTGGRKCARKVGDPAEVRTQYLLSLNIQPIDIFGLPTAAFDKTTHTKSTQ